jgi:hypothetical protein
VVGDVLAFEDGVAHVLRHRHALDAVARRFDQRLAQFLQGVGLALELGLGRAFVFLFEFGRAEADAAAARLGFTILLTFLRRVAAPLNCKRLL